MSMTASSSPSSRSPCPEKKSIPYASFAVAVRVDAERREPQADAGRPLEALGDRALDFLGALARVAAGHRRDVALAGLPVGVNRPDHARDAAPTFPLSTVDHRHRDA